MVANKSCRHQQHSMDTTTDSLIIPAGKVGLIITVKIGVSKSGQNVGQKWPKVCQFFFEAIDWNYVGGGAGKITVVD